MHSKGTGSPYLESSVPNSESAFSMLLIFQKQLTTIWKIGFWEGWARSFNVATSINWYITICIVATYIGTHMVTTLHKWTEKVSLLVYMLVDIFCEQLFLFAVFFGCLFLKGFFFALLDWVSSVGAFYILVKLQLCSNNFLGDCTLCFFSIYCH